MMKHQSAVISIINAIIAFSVYKNKLGLHAASDAYSARRPPEGSSVEGTIETVISRWS